MFRVAESRILHAVWQLDLRSRDDGSEGAYAAVCGDDLLLQNVVTYS